MMVCKYVLIIIAAMIKAISIALEGHLSLSGSSVRSPMVSK